TIKFNGRRIENRFVKILVSVFALVLYACIMPLLAAPDLILQLCGRRGFCRDTDEGLEYIVDGTAFETRGRA
ncbi:hypothetical protein LCGC14_2931430, partial [marine sediment metagenome]